MWVLLWQRRKTLVGILHCGSAWDCVSLATFAALCRPQLLHFKSPYPALPHIPTDFATFVSLWRENSGTECSRSGRHSQYHLLIWSNFSQIIWTLQLQTKIPSEFMLLDMLTLVLILQIGWLIGWAAFKWKRNNLFHYDSWNSSTCARLPVSCSYCWFVLMVLGMSLPPFPSQPSRFRASFKFFP